jgi:uncharacterized membrane protein YkvA (DUF1232 family)
MTLPLLRPTLWRLLLSQARLALRLLREPRVPMLSKGVPLLAAAYILSPLDFLPDVFPLVGQLDDLGIAVVALHTFLSLCPEGPKTFHQNAIAERRPYAPMAVDDDFIDAKFRREKTE